MAVKKNPVFLCCFFLLFPGIPVFSQEVAFDPEILTEDAVGESETPVLKKHPLVGISGMLVANGVISGWNRFVTRSSWAQVTLDDILNFPNRTVSFDTDWYWTNFVLHPYQGALYYMGARNSNMNMLESFLVTCAGSAIWEWGCELNAPSINDLVYTTVGAFAVGEMLSRLSVEAAAKSGFWSVVINPMRLYTVPLTGEKPSGTTGNLRSLSLLAGMGCAAGGGFSGGDFDDSVEVFPAFGRAEANVVYGNPFALESSVPYSQFDLKAGFAVGRGSGVGVEKLDKLLMYDIHIFSDGMFFSFAPDWGENTDTTIGMSMLYDFMLHSFMEFSSLAPAFAIKQKVYLEGADFGWQTHLGAVLLGTSDYYYLRREKIPTDTSRGTVRDYGYTCGAETAAALSFATPGGLSASLDLRAYGMYKYPFQKQWCDDTGIELFALADLCVEYAVSDTISMGISNTIFAKTCFFDEMPNASYALYSGSVYTRIRFI